MSVLSDEQLYNAIRPLCSSDELAKALVAVSSYEYHAVADAAIAADRAARAEPVGWWLHVKRHDAHYFAISEQERKGMEVLADQDDKIVPIYTAPPAAPVVPEGWKLVPAEVVEFLRGAAPLEGVWFGDRHPAERGAFWWRKRLGAGAAPSQDNGGAA